MKRATINTVDLFCGAGGAMRLVTPFVMDMSHPASEDGRRVTSADEPAKTMDEPIRTLTSVRKDYVCLPQLEDILIKAARVRDAELAAKAARREKENAK